MSTLECGSTVVKVEDNTKENTTNLFFSHELNEFYAYKNKKEQGAKVKHSCPLFFLRLYH